MALSTGPMDPSSTDCHTCRRGRLKCDRTRPACQKCLARATQCLGYGRLLRWNQGIASRGKMKGMTYAPSESRKLSNSLIDIHDDPYSRLRLLRVHCPSSSLHPYPSLDLASKKYLHYCKSPVFLRNAKTDAER